MKIFIYLTLFLLLFTACNSEDNNISPTPDFHNIEGAEWILEATVNSVDSLTLECWVSFSELIFTYTFDSMEGDKIRLDISDGNRLNFIFHEYTSGGGVTYKILKLSGDGVHYIEYLWDTYNEGSQFTVHYE